MLPIRRSVRHEALAPSRRAEQSGRMPTATARRYACVGSRAALGALAVALAACSSDSAVGSHGAPSSPSEAAVVPTQLSTEAPSSTYTVVAGDSIVAIANRFCVSSAVIVAANAWSDGIQHVIHPGDQLTIPSEACAPTSVIVATTTSSRPISAPATGQSPESSPTSSGQGGGIVSGPVVQLPFMGFDTGDGFTEYPNSACEPAFGAVYDFETSESPVETLIVALAALSGDIPESIKADIASFKGFRDQYFGVAKELEDRYGPYLEDLPRDDPDYERMVTAWLSGPRDAMYRILDHVRNECPAVPDTESTPEGAGP